MKIAVIISVLLLSAGVASAQRVDSAKPSKQSIARPQPNSTTGASKYYAPDLPALSRPTLQKVDQESGPFDGVLIRRDSSGRMLLPKR